MIYAAYQAQVDVWTPLRMAAGLAGAALSQPGWRHAGNGLRRIAAACEVLALASLTHSRPDFRIASVKIGDRHVSVHEEAAYVTPFATLLRFRKDVEVAQPRVLLVAPMSGHFATLLRETVRTMLVD